MKELMLQIYVFYPYVSIFINNSFKKNKVTEKPRVNSNDETSWLISSIELTQQKKRPDLRSRR